MDEKSPGDTNTEPAAALYTRAILEIEEGRAAAAIESLTTALELAGGSDQILWRIHRALSDALATEGEHGHAIEHLQISHRLLEEKNVRETEAQVRALEAEHDVESARGEAEIHRLRNVELARALSELKITQNRLIQAERIASLGSLTAGVAHEINNPVNFIMTSVPPLGRDFQELAAFIALALEERAGESAPEMLQRIRTEMEERDIGYVLEEIDLLLDGMRSGIARTREIIQGLSRFARQTGGDRRRHDLRDLIRLAVESLTTGAPEGIRFEIEADRSIPIECDASEIGQLLVNILTNAVQSIEQRGVIRISTRVDAGMVAISIADTGCGMSAEVGRRIFEPFFTTREVGSGVGLGLAIAYAIARRHAGEITVTSVEGKGSTFTIMLPSG